MKADLHIHSVSSPDGTLSPAEIKALCLQKGITAAAICDHDISPDSALRDDDFLWIPAIEYSTDKGHLLGLFLERSVPENPGRIPFAEAAKNIHDAGGICVLAHPFERTGKSEKRAQEIEALLPLIDGIEILNGRADYKFADSNLTARQFAEEHHIVCITGGSDAHLAAEVGACVTLLPECTTLEALRTAILAGADVEGGASPRRYVARSQFVKLRRGHGSLKRWCKTALLWLYLAGKDCLK